MPGPIYRDHAHKRYGPAPGQSLDDFALQAISLGFIRPELTKTPPKQIPVG